MHVLIIEADHNDADYVYAVHKLNDDELATFFHTILSVKASKNYNKNRFRWDSDPYEMYGDRVTEEDIEYLYDMFPYAEYGIHTITDITVFSADDMIEIKIV